MRPIREQMGVSGGIENLPWLFTATLVAMILLNVPFGYLVKLLPRIRFIPITYCFFAANIILFALALYLAIATRRFGSGGSSSSGSRFNLLVISIFWQHDPRRLHLGAGQAAVRIHCCRRDDRRDRRVGGNGASRAQRSDVGAACRRSVASRSRGLQHAASIALVGPALSQAGYAIGGARGRWQRICRHIHLLRSPYLLNVSLFFILFSITSTFLYSEQVGIAAKAFPDRGAQTTFFASVDLAVNILTLAIQLFLTGRSASLRRRIGARLAAASDDFRLWRVGLRTDHRCDRRVSGSAPCRQFRYCAADARGSVHRAAARGPL